MDLPLLSALFLVFAVALYVMLDGFDLGVGVLLLLQSEERLRDRMVDSIAPTWDGNETWLVMAGVALLAAFPIAYGVLLPALYVPICLMLLALGFRGVSIEFRSQAVATRRIWDGLFSVGSITAAAAQGVVLGALIQGIAVSGEDFAGGPLDAFTPFTLLTAATVVAGYALLGSAWLFMKGEAAVAAFAERAVSRLTPLFLVLGVVTCLMAYIVQPGVAVAWRERTYALAGATGSFAFAALVLVIADLRRQQGRAALPFVATLALFASSIAGLGIAIYPNVVPFRMTLWQAASTTSSHAFFLIGAAVVTPFVLGYSIFAYRVFRGRTPAGGWAE